MTKHLLPKPIRLMAIACPYGHLNDRGYAQATVPLFDAHTRRVGAELCLHTLKEDGVGHYHVTDKPVELVCPTLEAFDYYKRKFDEGALIAADEKTHKRLALVDITTKGRSVLRPYRDPLGVLAEQRKAAVAQWKAEHDGEEPDLRKDKPDPEAEEPDLRKDKPDPEADADEAPAAATSETPATKTVLVDHPIPAADDAAPQPAPTAAEEH